MSIKLFYKDPILLKMLYGIKFQDEVEGLLKKTCFYSFEEFLEHNFSSFKLCYYYFVTLSNNNYCVDCSIILYCIIIMWLFCNGFMYNCCNTF